MPVQRSPGRYLTRCYKRSSWRVAHHAPGRLLFVRVRLFTHTLYAGSDLLRVCLYGTLPLISRLLHLYRSVGDADCNSARSCVIYARCNRRSFYLKLALPSLPPLKLARYDWHTTHHVTQTHLVDSHGFTTPYDCTRTYTFVQIYTRCPYTPHHAPRMVVTTGVHLPERSRSW